MSKVVAKTRAQWAEELCADYKKLDAQASQLAQDAITFGKKLLAAKEGPDRLPHGEFLKMIERDLPFGKRKAQRLMEIARHPVLSNTTHGSYLPSSWRTLSELAQLSEEELEQAVTSGAINPDMTREQARSIRVTATYHNVGGGKVTIYGPDSVAKPPSNVVRYEEPTVARPRHMVAADADADPPMMRLVASATQPEQMPPLDVSSLALAQIERAVGELAMAIERGDVRMDDAAFGRRVKAAAHRLLALVDDEHAATIN
jgi:hypothetical protein